MKTMLPFMLTACTALLLTGCETSGTAARIQEKPAAYAALAPEQQQAIQAGTVAVGYTTDMIYLSLGKPSKIETKTTDDGPVTVWTYTRFYPTEGVAETWSVSRNAQAKLQVLFYQDKVFDAAITQDWVHDWTRSPQDTEGMADNRSDRGPSLTLGMIAAGITPYANPQVSTPPFVTQ